MSRIRSNMSNEERSRRLSNGNNEAYEICVSLATEINTYMLELMDRFDITGDLITKLYGICSRNMAITGLLLRACEDQIDGLTQDKLLHAIKNRGAGINITAIITKAVSKANRGMQAKNVHNN